jgi:hypothetical protein
MDRNKLQNISVLMKMGIGLGLEPNRIKCEKKRKRHVLRSFSPLQTVALFLPNYVHQAFPSSPEMQTEYVCQETQ